MRFGQTFAMPGDAAQSLLDVARRDDEREAVGDDPVPRRRSAPAGSRGDPRCLSLRLAGGEACAVVDGRAPR